EALASGIPAVAVKQGGPIDLLHARVGALATPGDPVDFADKLARVLADKSLAQHCRAYVAEHFSWDKTCMKLLAIYDSLHTRGTKDPALSPSPTAQGEVRGCRYSGSEIPRA